jgi:hypothetical protein
MKLSNFAATLLMVSSLTLWPGTSSGALDQTPPKIVEYNERVAMSTGQVRKGDICLDFYPDLESDEFFKGLQRIDNEYGSEFQKYSHPVTTYPSRLAIQIDLRTSVCDADVYTPAPVPEFLKTLRFKVQWKRQLYLRPVAGYSVANVPLNLDDDQGRRLLVIQIRDANNIPLTDHLILTIFSPEGKLLSRMVARL